MGISERKERERQRRLTEIVDAAEIIFFEKGFKSTTMDEIAKQAELSKGTLYLYYNSKDHLYSQIMYRALKILHNRFLEATAKVKLGIDKVLAIGEAYSQFHIDNNDYFNVMMNFEINEMHQKDFVAMKTDQRFDPHIVLIESIKIGVKDGSIRKDIKPNETAMVLWAFTTGLMQLTTHKKGLIEKGYNLDIKEINNMSYQILTHGIRK